MRACFLAAVVLSLACGGDDWPRPEPISHERFVAEFNAWRDDRRDRLVRPPAGPVILAGLWELNEGAMPMGADSSLPIALSVPGATRRAGTIHRSGPEIRFEPAPRAGVRLANGTPVTVPLALQSDRTHAATVLALGSLRLRVHGEPGTDRLWLRAWDEDHPDRATFRLPDTYPPDTAWRLAARFERFPEPREYRVPDVVAGTQAYLAPGELIFRVRGREFRLAANADSGSTTLFIMFWDSTARSTTYEAGRYIRTPLPDSTGWTVIDFNRAYNPPCVFTPYSTCAFPPPGNRLALAVPAGEKRREPPQRARSDSVLVEVGGVTRTLTGAELRALPQDTVRARAHQGPPQVFVGPSLAAVLATHGARVDSLRSRALAQYVVVEARDAFRVVFGVGEVSAGLTGRRVILAHTADGTALDTATGPWRVIAEGDLRPARWIRHVSAIRLRAAPSR